MKNIQVIDGALNCAYDIFAATDEEFNLIFPADEQDIQFAEDIISDNKILTALDKIWKRRLDKKSVNGIHGTLFYELEFKKEYYPNKKEKDITKSLGRALIDESEKHN